MYAMPVISRKLKKGWGQKYNLFYRRTVVRKVMGFQIYIYIYIGSA